MSWKKSPLVTSEIFRLFVNTSTPDDKYSRRNIQIFCQQLQKPLSQKENTFFSVFDCISEMWMKFRTFWKKEEYSSLIITEGIASEGDIYLSVEKVMLQHTIRESTC